MTVNDIVNRDLINLVNCESEPIHIPGSIQPFGFLLVLSGDELNIEFCSANTDQFIKWKPADILGKNLSLIVADSQLADFKNYLNGFNPGVSYPFVFEWDDVPYNTTVQTKGDYYILELEPFPDGQLSLPDLYGQMRHFIAHIEHSNNLRDLCDSLAIETRRITGYDRVMVYRFDEQYNGEIFSESRRDDLQSFLDHRYPHTDIPAQARELYLKNLLRIIIDVNYEPVPILTHKSNATNASVDLSNAILRSVSPIHIEYLKNMGVSATLTISLILEGKLWGLIACHHYEAKNLPHYTRLAIQMQGHFLTSQIRVQEVKAEYEVSLKSDSLLKELLQQLSANDAFVQKNYTSPALLSMLNAGGMAIVVDGVIRSNGHIPDDQQLLKLVHWLEMNSEDGWFKTNNLSDRYQAASSFAATASGVVYYSLSALPGNCILWFRPEMVQTIHWAGDPNKAVIKGEDGMRLTPRKSFELWREEVKGKSLDWGKPEINAAASFAYALQKHIHNQLLAREETRYRKLSEQLQEANEELANINWISTHDLKEPLRKIQIFGSRIVEDSSLQLNPVMQNSVQRMRESANRLQQLLDDMLAYSQVSRKAEAFVAVDLNVLLQEVLNDVSDEIASGKVTITIDPLPVVNGIVFQLKQLFINLLSNALKFSKPEEPPVISITHTTILLEAEESLRYHKISFSDNGIGFEEQYASRIFEVFQRLHTAIEYKGTGIGLAICRKIVANHNGHIKTESKPGEGATFHILLPLSE